MASSKSLNFINHIVGSHFENAVEITMSNIPRNIDYDTKYFVLKTLNNLNG